MKAALIAAAALLAATPAWAQEYGQPAAPQTTPSPQASTPQAAAPATAEDFVRQAIQDNIGDVEMNRMARENAEAPQTVRELANRIALYNIELNGELARLAQANQVAVSNELLDRDRQAIERLSSLRGEDFTAAYLGQLVTDLERELSRYQEAASLIEDQQVRQFAAAAVPRIQQHLQTARAVQDAQTAAAPQSER